MKGYLIQGGTPLLGEVEISGTKNAALAVLFACILIKEPCVIENVPSISDIEATLSILRELGARVIWRDRACVCIDATQVETFSLQSEEISKMRASCYLLGALVGRFQRACIPYPGGCNFGKRPIDQHFKGFCAMGCQCREENGTLWVETAGLHHAALSLDVPSVGATINLMIAAVASDGVTKISNAAREPHVCQVGAFLNACGADVRGIGTSVLEVHGGKPLHGCTFRIAPDMIETGTYLIAALATGGAIRCTHTEVRQMEAVLEVFREMGAKVSCGEDWIEAERNGTLRPISVATAPYPGFATDLHPPLAALLAMANGESRMRETVWASRFQYLQELQKMGVRVEIMGEEAIFCRSVLRPATVCARDLRGGAAVLIAALAAEGESEICHVEPIERGYERPIEKLRKLGAKMQSIGTT